MKTSIINGSEVSRLSVAIHLSPFIPIDAPTPDLDRLNLIGPTRMLFLTAVPAALRLAETVKPVAELPNLVHCITLIHRGLRANARRSGSACGTNGVR